VIFDRLIDRALLAEAPLDAERIDVGKRPGDAPVSQDQINALILDRAEKGLRVVRLKGGDPFIFGRGFEELTACRKAGIDCVVIPGVSSATRPGSRGYLRRCVFMIVALTPKPPTQTMRLIFSNQRRDTLVILKGRARPKPLSTL
jgi:siroheme synthase